MMETLQTPEEIRAFVISVIREEFKRPTSFTGSDKELLERMVKVEEELKHIHVRFDENRQYQEKRFDDLKEYNSRHFEAIDKRFEAIEKRFEFIDKRFESMDKNMKWLIGSAFVLISLLMTFYKFLA